MSEVTRDTGKTTILLVDDDPAVRRVTVRLLEYLKCSVVAVEGGHDAISTIQDQNNRFDLVITDYSMPEMNGVELTLNLKKIIPDMPVILYTGADSGADDQFMFDSGVTEILPKPFTRNELDLSIRRVINR